LSNITFLRITTRNFRYLEWNRVRVIYSEVNFSRQIPDRFQVPEEIRQLIIENKPNGANAVSSGNPKIWTNVETTIIAFLALFLYGIL
jgi:hypothetical protein